VVAGKESDSDVRRVPEMSGNGLGVGTVSSRTHEKGGSGPPLRKRGGASADKEHKRLKRSEYKSLSNLSQIADSTIPMELAVSKNC
jgi:hypothetical protein